MVRYCANCTKRIKDEPIKWVSSSWGNITTYWFDKQCYDKVVKHD